MYHSEQGKILLNDGIPHECVPAVELCSPGATVIQLELLLLT